jgi:hypothetical protein
MSTKQWSLTLFALVPLAAGFSARAQLTTTKQPTARQITAKKAPAAGSVVVHLHRWVEPGEQALSVLVPQGWIAEGGVVRIDPRKGPTNSVGAKIDVTIKKDQAGSVMIHWFPNITYKDPRGFGGLPGFPVGSNYMGSMVYPLQDPHSFLLQVGLRLKRPQAQNIQVTERKPLTELAQKYQQQATMPNIQYQAGMMTVTYDEGGAHYTEKMMAVIEYVSGQGLGMWTNHQTLAVRAPTAEIHQMAPLMDVIVDSLKGNPQWVAAENQGAAQRARNSLETQRYLQDQRHQMVERQREVNAEARHSHWLEITGQDDYVNPHTGKVEQGSNEYSHRWENSSGDVIYTNNPDYDPTRDDSLQGRTDYKVTPLRPR